MLFLSLFCFGVLVLLLSAHSGSTSAAVPANVTNIVPGAESDARTAWLNRGKFGMFVHWGLYSALGRDEWVMHREQIPVVKYARLAETFDPVKFDADEWVAVAKRAGMKYITVTSKHHDGFCLFDSSVDEFNSVTGSPFGRDVIGELKAACERAGIKLGIYYSHAQDWSRPGGACYGGAWDPVQEGDFHAYWESVAIPQVKELLKRYEPSHLWLDTPVGINQELARELVEVVRSIKPDTLINSRLLYQGFQVISLSDAELDELDDMGVDFLSYPDRNIPAQSPWHCWETCMTLNESWGFKAGDDHWKSPKQVITQLVEVVSKGGTFLLNMAPTGDGEMPAEGVSILDKVGRWLTANGEAVYDAKPSTLEGKGTPTAESVALLAELEAKAEKTGLPIDPNMRLQVDYEWLATAKGRTLYIHLLGEPAEMLVIEEFTGTIKSAAWLSDPERSPLAYDQSEDSLTVHISTGRPSGLVPVVVLEMV